ncbi:MAG: hypothetical protein WCA15_01005 [Candidatus Acidiferrales bacterium]
MTSVDTRNSEEVLLAQFEDCSLPLECFHHSVHVQIAFLYLRKFSVLEVLTRFPAALTKYANAHGKNGLYHETITWAYVLLINERMRRADQKLSWDEFRAQNPDLLTWKHSVLKKYYRAETLSSELAKGTFLFPDNGFSKRDATMTCR